MKEGILAQEAKIIVAEAAKAAEKRQRNKNRGRTSKFHKREAAQKTEVG